MGVVETAIRQLAGLYQNDPLVAVIVVGAIVITVGLFLWFQGQSIRLLLSQTNILIKGMVMTVFILMSFYFSAAQIGTAFSFSIGLIGAFAAYRLGFYQISEQWEERIENEQ